jgi:peptide/nickel transport system ATP-binding protein
VTVVFLVVIVALTSFWIAALVDAARRPGRVWHASGHNQTAWLIGIALLGAVLGIFYWFAVRPSLRAAEATAEAAERTSGAPKPELRSGSDALLRVEDLVVEFAARGGQKVHAVSGISLDILEGETLGLVGESGCGKSTTGRAIVQLPPPISGSVKLDGTELTELSGNALRRTRPRMQMIFQDPISSLNPRRKVRDIVAEGLDIWSVGDKATRAAKVDEVLNAVGIDPANANRRPHEFSGGQCQRISIARAMVTEPKLIICDEPVSALDVSVQAQIINLLQDMKDRYGLTLVFIAHDLAVVKNVSDRIMVMYLGKVCEVGVPEALYDRPTHPYTAALLAAIPVPDPQTKPDSEKVLGGEIPSPLSPPSGCRFRTRCPKAEPKCAEDEPRMREIVPNHFVACHFPLEPGEVLDFTKAGSGAFIGLDDGAATDDDL